MQPFLRFSLCFATALLLLPTAQSAELLVSNVNGYTLDSHGKLQQFQALLVDHGKVVATGTTDELTKRANSAEIIDGHGKTLLPGLIDAHGHVLELGYARDSVDLSGTKSLDGALAEVKAYAAAHH